MWKNDNLEARGKLWKPDVNGLNLQELTNRDSISLKIMKSINFPRYATLMPHASCLMPLETLLSST